MRKFHDEYYCDDGEDIENETLTPKETQYFLACSPSTFYKLVRSGELPAFKVGKQWRVLREDLQSFCRRSSLL